MVRYLLINELRHFFCLVSSWLIILSHLLSFALVSRRLLFHNWLKQWSLLLFIQLGLGCNHNLWSLGVVTVLDIVLYPDWQEALVKARPYRLVVVVLLSHEIDWRRDEHVLYLLLHQLCDQDRLVQCCVLYLLLRRDDLY